MNQKTAIKHVGLQYKDRRSAETFFVDILGLKFKKSFSLSKDLSKSIFGISEDITVDVYANNESYFEVFITDQITKYHYEHVCIEIESKSKFIEKCKKYGLKPIIVKRDLKTLLFIKDFSGNLYEVKGRN
jgi:hypothetical protein